MSMPRLFDRELRRLRRDRAVRAGGDFFLHEYAFAELLDRLGDVRRTFNRALLIGCPVPIWPQRLRAHAKSVTIADPSLEAARRVGGVVADEDRLPFADESFDLVLAAGTLDGVDDLPGALLLLRRVLEPDGLMLGVMAGAGSLPRLRSAMLAADWTTGGAAPRLHPALDVRTAGDLLARAGFALPVADSATLEISYRDLDALVRDLRGHGATNLLARRSRTPLGRPAMAAATADFAAAGIDGRTLERVDLLFLSGWAPVR